MWLWILGATTLALSTAAAVAANRFSNARRGGDMERFRKTQSGARGEGGDSGGERDQSVGADRVTSYLSAGKNAPAGSDASLWSADERDFDRLGEHVSSVLNAAKEAAARIHEEAREEADRFRAHAQAEAFARSEAAREEAEATKSEAQKMRASAEEWADQARQAAEAYAADHRSEAQAEAKRIISEAERQAVSISDEAKRRDQALRMDISLAEDRLRQLALSLHEVAARLDGLLAIPAEGSEGAESSLVDDLRPASRETEDVTK